MGDGYDRFENEGAGGGGSFVMGLLTGTVLGAGLGMLFAPKAGSEMRNQISEQASNIANTASEGYRRASETANDLANRGRDMYDKAREAVSRGADEAQRYVRDATSGSTMSGSQMASGSTGGVNPSSSTGSHSSSSGTYTPPPGGGSHSGSRG